MAGVLPEILQGGAEMKSIPVGQYLWADVDDIDFERVSQYQWHSDVRRHTAYVSNGQVGYLHRFILDVDGNIDIDHRDGNGLNNCRSNLRPCSRSQNLLNGHLTRNGAKKTSRFRGVARQGPYKKWVATIRPTGMKTIYLGSFEREEDAARAYDEVAIKHHGEFARINGV